MGSCWHGKDLVNTWCDEFSVRAGMGWFCQHKLRYVFSASWYGMDLVNTFWYAFYVLASMEGIWSTHDVMHLLTSLALIELGQYTLSCILWSRWHWMRFVNTCKDGPCVLAGMNGFGQQMLRYICVLTVMEWVLSTRFEIHFMFSLTDEGFCQNLLRWILCPR